MSNKHQFEFLELEEKMELVFNGQFVSSIEFESRTASLYLLENEYYVEVFSEVDSKKIDFISFASEQRLALYIDLDKLMK